MRSLAYFFTLIIIATSCKHNIISTEKKEIYYTCSMHAQVHSAEEGKCPICGMDLIPVNSKQIANSGELELSDEQIKLANIQFDTLKPISTISEKTLTGTIVINEKDNNNIASYISGRITKMYFKNVGDYIPKGAPIYTLYSEELNTAKQEYILLLSNKKSTGNSSINFDELINSAKSKLQLWGMSLTQIAALKIGVKPSLVTTFYSSASGFITNVSSNEGSYIMEGQIVYSLANTSSVWVEAQAYSTQPFSIKTKTSVVIKIPDLNNKEFKSKIEFIDPVINPESHINLIRIEIPNANHEVKPGMLAKVFIKENILEGFRIPTNAVVSNQNMQSVWIQTASNKFRFQMINTAVESEDSVQVISGLKTGDVVVTSGSYLLNSEYKSRNGTSPMAGMKM